LRATAACAISFRVGTRARLRFDEFEIVGDGIQVAARLKRIQLERPRHGVNPPAFRAVAAALHADYGRPDQTCVIPVLPASGYQAAAEEKWVRGGVVISAIFRDTTLQAFEGCLFGPASGWLRFARPAIGAHWPT
jgi:hypothetical protein